MLGHIASPQYEGRERDKDVCVCWAMTLWRRNGILQWQLQVHRARSTGVCVLHVLKATHWYHPRDRLAGGPDLRAQEYLQT
ncbi:hypothetical protein BC835DRAFT_681450 [Cytidiella melzeri]|nr:hypothetical protein BC835DRAFT_681450 [Cytidiella melzeri]